MKNEFSKDMRKAAQQFELDLRTEEGHREALRIVKTEQFQMLKSGIALE